MTSPDKPQRVVLAASYGPSLGPFRGPLIREMTARGHQVLCVAPDIDAALAGQLSLWGAQARTIPLARTGLNPLRDAVTLRTLTRIFRDWRPDVVMGYTSKPAIYGSLAARHSGVGRIVPMITGLGYAFLEGGGVRRAVIRRIMSALYRRAIASSTAVVFHNRDDAKIFASLGIVPRGVPVIVTPGSGVDTDHYTHRPLPPTNGTIRFLMISRLVRYKGVTEYCEAARLAKQHGVNASWVLVGPTESGPASLPLREIERYRDAVTYLGPADDVRPLLQEAHVYVLPSYGEGMPRTVLEAMATGRPIITTDTRGCRDTVRTRSAATNGVVVPPHDSAALAEAMMRLAAQRDRLAAMGAESRRIAEREFDVARVNAVMLNALGLTNASRLSPD